jgi:hypothetical protein
LKRLIASRKLRRRCIACNAEFKKGDVCYRERKVYTDWGVIAFEALICPKCKHKQAQHNTRFEEFQSKCTHPDRFVETKWSYIPGECIKEPDYDYCRLCNKTLGGD